MTDIPRRVGEAKAAAARLGVGIKCSDEAGALLRVLAAARPGGVVGEIGAGCGVGTAWLLGGCAPDTRLVTVERVPERAAAVHHLFADDPRVTVLSGDWQLIEVHAPFDLLFVDAAPPKHRYPERLLPLVAPGGVVVLDDLTPLPNGREEVAGRSMTLDPVRAFWHAQPGWTVSEVAISADEAVLLAVSLVTQPGDA